METEEIYKASCILAASYIEKEALFRNLFLCLCYVSIHLFHHIHACLSSSIV